jgi:hypothetical protein
LEFNAIRNKIQKFSYESLTGEIISLLSILEESKNPQNFWHPLTLLKWSLEFAGEKYPPKTATRNDILNLLNQMEALEMKHNIFNLSSNGKKVNKMLTVLSPQQFQYQEKAWWNTLAMQYQLFIGIKGRYNIENSFAKLTGIELEQFLQMLYIILIVLFHDEVPGQKRMPLSMASDGITGVFGQELHDKLIGLFTVSRASIKSELEKDNRTVKNYILQVFETSFFTRKPFLLIADKLLIPHRDIFNITCNHYIYEYLKAQDPNFTTEMGNRMEKYVRMGLEELKLNFQTENDLKKQIGLHHNLVDFLVEGNILVEVKALEIKPYTSVNPTDELLKSELKKTISKAYIKQMLSVANTIKQRDKEYFGIIVTYKELYLGNSSDLWDQFLREEALSHHQEISTLPIENLFIIDLRSWDQLLQVMMTHRITLIDILKKAREDDRSSATKKFTFGMHLNDYKTPKITLSYLLEGQKHITLQSS